MRLLYGLALVCFITVAAPAPSWAEEKKEETNFVHLNPILFPVLSASGGVQQFVSVNCRVWSSTIRQRRPKPMPWSRV